MISNMHRNHQMRTKYILTLIIFVLQTINMQAQHYVYSVTIGTSWARQVFPDQERAQRKKLEAHPFVIKGAPCFSKTFLDFEYDFKRYNAYNDSIFLPMQQEDWIDMFKRRAVKYSELYGKNNANLSVAKETDFNNKSGVPKNKINYLYNLTESYVTVLENTSFPQEKKGKIIKEYFHSLLDIFSRYEHSKYPFEKGKILSTIATNPRLLKYLNAEEKSDLIGEQFHPKLVNFINTEPQLYAKLKAVVRDGRYDKYYTLYKRYMSDKKPVKTTKKE